MSERQSGKKDGSVIRSIMHIVAVCILFLPVTLPRMILKGIKDGFFRYLFTTVIYEEVADKKTGKKKKVANEIYFIHARSSMYRYSWAFVVALFFAIVQEPIPAVKPFVLPLIGVSYLYGIFLEHKDFNLKTLLNKYWYILAMFLFAELFTLEFSESFCRFYNGQVATLIEKFQLTHTPWVVTSLLVLFSLIAVAIGCLQKGENRHSSRTLAVVTFLVGVATASLYPLFVGWCNNSLFPTVGAYRIAYEQFDLFGLFAIFVNYLGLELSESVVLAFASFFGIMLFYGVIDGYLTGRVHMKYNELTSMWEGSIQKLGSTLQFAYNQGTVECVLKGWLKFISILGGGIYFRVVSQQGAGASGDGSSDDQSSYFGTSDGIHKSVANTVICIGEYLRFVLFGRWRVWAALRSIADRNDESPLLCNE